MAGPRSIGAMRTARAQRRTSAHRGAMVAVRGPRRRDCGAMTDLATLDIIGSAELVRRGEVTALELLDAAIARIEAARELNAVICDLFDRAREQAAGPLGDGPLAGAPFLLKDLGGTIADAPERMGSVALRDHVSPATSVVVERYLDAGLLIAGKTNTPEWGNHCTTEPVLFGSTV